MGQLFRIRYHFNGDASGAKMTEPILQVVRIVRQEHQSASFARRLKTFPIFSGILKKKMGALCEFSLIRIFSEASQHACVLTRCFCTETRPLIDQQDLTIGA
jgi:hypothetical protein